MNLHFIHLLYLWSRTRQG